MKKTKKYIVFLLIAVMIFNINIGVEAAPTTKFKTVSFSESTLNDRSQTVTIPNLERIVGVTVNTGNITYTVNGDNITIRVIVKNPCRTKSRTETRNGYMRGIVAPNVWSVYEPSATMTCSIPDDFLTIHGANPDQLPSVRRPMSVNIAASLTSKKQQDDGSWRSSYYWSGTYNYSYDVTVTTNYYACKATIEYIDNSNPTITAASPSSNSPLLALNNTVGENV